jgi:hypothetical protein
MKVLVGGWCMGAAKMMSRTLVCGENPLVFAQRLGGKPKEGRKPENNDVSRVTIDAGFSTDLSFIQGNDDRG